MINFFYETEVKGLEENKYAKWIAAVIESEGKEEGEINYIFCNDEYLLKINKNFLDHDTLTDIISFDNTMGNELGGDIFISYDRIKENAVVYEVSVDEELKRVMVHGVLHFCGFKDKTDEETKLMRSKEDEKMKMFHVER